MNDYELFTRETTAFFYNLKEAPIQQILDFDFICSRKPSIAAIIHPGRSGFHKAFFGSREILMPVYGDISEAAKKHPDTDVVINFASFRSAFNSSKEALEQPSIRTIAIMAEGMPERQTRELIAIAKKSGKTIIGPSTWGGVAAGRFRIGIAGGTAENIVKSKMHRPGDVGLVSKSGGLSNEFYHMLGQITNGIYEGIAVGGDTYPGSTMLYHILRYEANPQIKMILGIGELGGAEEYGIIEAKKQGKIIKPIIMWTTGTCAKVFPYEVQFGHAGARSGKELESADAKNQAMREAGIIVPNSFEELEHVIKETYEMLKKEGKVTEKPAEEVPKLPLDYSQAVREGIVRKQTNFITTISSDAGEEPTYCGIPISEMIEKNYTFGDIISLLWFKKKFPPYITKFFDMCIAIAADHGPAVSGAHNAIIAARAGKDVISSLCSGLLTIGPRFGGATDDACRYFREACDSGIKPEDFVENMKKRGILIPGIGHRVKSLKNPDKRVELLKDYANKHFPETKYLDYALEVEKVTTKKAENLILNIDGCIAALFLDLMNCHKEFTKEEIDHIVDIGYMNGLFAVVRSIGIVGHILDQKRLNQGLYRHPSDDILYHDDNEKC